MLEIEVNGTKHRLDVDPAVPLLWVLRDSLGLKGTKFGCGAGLCGACTVHVDGTAVRSCAFSVGQAAGSKITSIEGLSASGDHPVQIAWREGGVPQCGYCQPGMIMAAAAFLKNNSAPSDEEIAQGVTNICRCGTYNRIRKAIRSAAESVEDGQ
ncbi:MULTISPECIES: (2Fe-2S)-binding protein [Sphingomonadaceae]|jgi:aerobic-type carbon monoxide dehydrogenase small subunit (CoxS/CutS family)|uniref:(2Fe-2S)-binding protein n=1 Tax=Sphingomonadales TaxID=204457 RepID=UPI000C1110CE|nr:MULTISPECIES: (2Fe-2S)-binding protein [Sphingomonadaceae]PHQ63939.1 MAG: (2Fe-2S)-binding protein [Sphingobium sp.]